MSQLILYGIKNCDSVKKARSWLESHNVDYVFHDFRSEGLDEPMVREWLKKVGSEALLNKKSTTWRNLSEPEKQMAESDSGLVSLFVQNPTLIKRPVLESGQTVQAGFREDAYQQLFSR